LQDKFPVGDQPQSTTPLMATLCDSWAKFCVSSPPWHSTLRHLQSAVSWHGIPWPINTYTHKTNSLSIYRQITQITYVINVCCKFKFWSPGLWYHVVYKLNIIHSVHFNSVFIVRQMYILITLIV
jgi:hypothetical protein